MQPWNPRSLANLKPAWDSESGRAAAIRRWQLERERQDLRDAEVIFDVACLEAFEYLLEIISYLARGYRLASPHDRAVLLSEVERLALSVGHAGDPSGSDDRAR
jgi:hypothetical protein